VFKKSKFKKPQFYVITLLGTCSRFSCRFPIHLAGVVLLLIILFLFVCVPPSVISGTGPCKFVASTVSHLTPCYQPISTLITTGNQSSIEMKVATARRREQSVSFCVSTQSVARNRWLQKKNTTCCR